MRDVSPAATRTPPQRIGDQLFEALFSGPVRSLFDRSLGMIHGDQLGLRIKLHIDPEDPDLAQLASLPWEFLYRKETRDFLNLSVSTPVLRYLDVQRPYEPLPLRPPLRVLVVVSAPVGCTKLNLERERALIESSWARQEGVVVEYMERATILALQERLAARPYHVLHYMGHGDFDPSTGQGVLLMEDEQRARHDVDGRTLGVLLRDEPTLRLVILNACETATVTRDKGLDPFAGVAAAIVMSGIPAVVAMQFPISDRAAITFAQRFYPLLAQGCPVDEAVAEGRKAIRFARPGTLEWGTPVLFMRAPDGVLFDVTGPAPGPEPDLKARLEQLYTDGLSAYYLEDWEQACRCFSEIVDLCPDYEDAANKLQESQEQRELARLYAQAQVAHQAEDWPAAIAALQALAARAPDYRDAAALLEQARRKKRLTDLYAEAQQLHRAKQWEAVLRVFERIEQIDPEHPDPEGLLAAAEEAVEEARRQDELKRLYGHALRERDAGRLQSARRSLARVLEIQPGYQQAEQHLARVEARIDAERAEREKRERLDTLYQQAVALAHAEQWAEALAKMDEISEQDEQYPDPEGIAAAARAKENARKQEAKRQKRLAALYAEAVRLLRAGQGREALEQWHAVRALDPHYPDRHKIEATVRRRQRPRGGWLGWLRGLPNWATVALVGGGMVAVVPAIALLANGLGEGPLALFPAPTHTTWPTRTPRPPTHTPRPPTPTPTSLPFHGRIVFTSDRDGNSEIYVMNADGSGQTNLTNNPADDFGSSWSPTGKRIAFASNRDGNLEIYVMNADGSGQTKLTDNPANDLSPAWSPNGGRIAFTSNRGGSGNIFVMNANGTGVTQFTDLPYANRASWSPDGWRIAFYGKSNNDDRFEIYVMNADGSGQEQLTSNAGDTRSPAWSPDGTRIAFWTELDGNGDLYVMNADGSGLTRLTNNPADNSSPFWSPDGAFITFSSCLYRCNIYVVNSDGSGLENLTKHASDNKFPCWSPDGQ